ncbi:MAG: GDSL-type esterase/lipase family protein [Acidobacteriota bacterium]
MTRKLFPMSLAGRPAPTAAALLVAACLTTPLYAQTPPGEAAGATERVLLVGDSWTWFMWQNETMRDVFADNGFPGIIEVGGATTINGSTAADWSQPGNLQLITDALAARPTIDIVQLTIGGNDFLDGQPGGGWFVGMTPAEFDAMADRIRSDAQTVIDHILGLDPDLQILLSLYDYANFEDGTLIGCSGRWTDLGQPTPRQLNQATLDLEAAIASLGDDPRVTLIGHAGLMQFTFGFPGDGVPPGQLLPPGDLDRPSPVESMFFFIVPDCIHLSGDGYYAVGQNLWNRFYEAQFTGLIFGDGFETGDLSSWSTVIQ